MAPEGEPLAFLKGASTLIGHRAAHRRPADVTVHALRVRAGDRGRQDREEGRARRRLDFVAGYTVANDYAIRDYLENWYRPNLRVKNRDTCTRSAPGSSTPPTWPTRGAGAAAPRQRQAHAVGQHQRHDLRRALLIEYFSSFMTLPPGDVILTGTPEGVVDVHAPAT